MLSGAREGHTNQGLPHFFSPSLELPMKSVLVSLSLFLSPKIESFLKFLMFPVFQINGYGKAGWKHFGVGWIYGLTSGPPYRAVLFSL